MEKKEFPKKDNRQFSNDSADFSSGPSPFDGLKAKIGKISDKVFAVIKLLLGLCLLVLVYASTLSFLDALLAIESSLRNTFWAGVISFLAAYLFIFEPAVIYRKGQKILEVVFKFFAPLVKFAPYVLPIYTIILFLVYLLLNAVITADWLMQYFIFLFGFSVALHLVFSAKTLRIKQGDFLKSNYIFGFSFVYVTNMIIMAACLNFVFEKFSFLGFFNNTFGIAGEIFGSVFRQLFATG
jgi:hypothetical protein